MGAPKVDRDMFWCWGYDGRVPKSHSLEEHWALCDEKNIPVIFIERVSGAYILKMRDDVFPQRACWPALETGLRSILGGLVNWGHVLSRRPHILEAGSQYFTASFRSLSRAQDTARQIIQVFKENGICTEEDYR